MGQLILENAVQALRTAGYAVEQGFPGELVPGISGPVCAVNLHSAKLTEGNVAVTVRVICPVELGAGVCEQTALAVGRVLEEQGGQCTVSACDFDSRIGMFAVEVTAEYTVGLPVITIDGTACRYVRHFSAWKKLDSTWTDWGLAPWEFELEERFPAGEEQLTPEGSFVLICTDGSGTEIYENATWSYRKREWEPNGIRQIRRGVSSSRTFSRAE